MRTLQNLQSQLETIYELNVGYPIQHFVVTDPRFATGHDNPEHARRTPEKLLIAQSDDSLDVALYLDADLLQRLEKLDTRQHLQDENLPAFWIALEGVSHFLYLTWNAHHDREVSLLEMELQAEVDKYVTALLLAEAIASPLDPDRVYDRLFTNADFDPALSPSDRQRYEDANHYAQLYCGFLAQRFGNDAANKQQLTNEIRRFYRYAHHKKIDYIRKTHRG